MAQNNQTLTDIAIKRLSGKANTNAKSTVAQEPIGSTVQTVAGTVFAEVMPNDPINDASTHLFVVQSASLADPGTVMLVDFEVVAIGDEYQNDFSNTNDELDEGDNDPSGNPNTYHSYGLILSGTFQSNASSNNFDTLASTGTTLGSAPFIDGYFMTGSRGKLQIVPEYVSSTPAGIGANNTYTPVLYNNTGVPGPSTVIDPTAAIDWYLDPYSGVLFVQDPVDFGTANPDGSSPNSDSSIPGVLRAFIYVGKYQDEVTFGANDVNFKVSGSDDGFDVGNSDTINFVSGSAGITVESNSSTGTITIGTSTDNVTFNQITGSIGSSSLSNVVFTNLGDSAEQIVEGSLRITQDIVAENYIVSSSVTYMTQSFSSGSTIFGDSDNDTHQFTGSISILHTGSGYGFELSGSSINIDAGSSGSLTLGTHNVGLDIGSPLEITGSGLIVSQSGLPSNHYNMIKVGEIEMVDYTGTANNSFLIDVKHNRTIIISSSNTNSPVAELANASHKLYNGSVAAVEVTSTNNNFTNSNITLSATTALNIKPSSIKDSGINNNNKYILISQNDPSSSPSEFKSLQANSSFPVFGGPITASAVSSSGLLYASASDDNGVITTMAVAMYDTASGRFYYTASNSIQGDTTDIEADITLLQASASAGIYLWTGSEVGASVSLTETASWNASGDGLTVDFDESANAFTYTIAPFDVVNSAGTAISGAINAATGSVLLNYGLLSSSQQIATDISGAIDAATASLSASIVGTANEVEVTSGGTPGNIVIGLPNDVTISNNLTVEGSASIAGDLIVQGAVTSIRTDNLNVADQFILLNSSSSDPDSDGGIIIQTDGSANGTALFYDNSANRWALAESSSVAWDDLSATAHQYVVSVSQSNAAPTGDPSNFGLNEATRYGMMYVDTSDTSGDGGLYIYLP